MFVCCLSFGAVVAFANKIKIALQIFIVAATVTANKANFQVVGRVVKAMATAHKSTPAPRKTAANPKASSNGEGLAHNAITAQPKPSAYRHGRAAFAPKDAPPRRFPACLKILLVLPITPASRILSLDDPFVRRSVQPKQPALGSLPNKPSVCPLANKIEIAALGTLATLLVFASHAAKARSAILANAIKTASPHNAASFQMADTARFHANKTAPHASFVAPPTTKQPHGASAFATTIPSALNKGTNAARCAAP